MTDALVRLTELAILTEITGRRRGKVYGYTDYLELLDEGADTRQQPRAGRSAN